MLTYNLCVLISVYTTWLSWQFLRHFPLNWTGTSFNKCVSQLINCEQSANKLQSRLIYTMFIHSCHIDLIHNMHIYHLSKDQWSLPLHWSLYLSPDRIRSCSTYLVLIKIDFLFYCRSLIGPWIRIIIIDNLIFYMFLNVFSLLWELFITVRIVNSYRFSLNWNIIWIAI